MIAVEPAARRFGRLATYLDERQRRLLLAVEAAELGRGGVSMLATATGAARSTIQAELNALREENRRLRDALARKLGGQRADDRDGRQ